MHGYIKKYIYTHTNQIKYRMIFSVTFTTHQSLFIMITKQCYWNRQDINCLVLVSMLFPVRLDIWTADLTSVLFCFIEKVSFPLLKIQRCIHLCLCRFLRILTCLHLPAPLLLFKSKSFIKQYSDHDFSYAVFRQCDCISAHICNCVTALYCRILGSSWPTCLNLDIEVLHCTTVNTFVWNRQSAKEMYMTKTSKPKKRRRTKTKTCIYAHRYTRLRLNTNRVSRGY